MSSMLEMRIPETQQCSVPGVPTFPRWLPTRVMLTIDATVNKCLCYNLVLMDTSDIDAQIAALQEKKRLIVAKAAADAKAAEKKAANILVRSTPTKGK